MRAETSRPSVLIIAIPTLALISAVLLVQHYFPQISCPIRSQTGIDCPGCGGTRATQHLLKGDLKMALHFNAFITSGIIAIILFSIWSLLSKLLTGKYTALPINLKTACLALTMIIVFTVLRNL